MISYIESLELFSEGFPRGKVGTGLRVGFLLFVNSKDKSLRRKLMSLVICKSSGGNKKGRGSITGEII